MRTGLSTGTADSRWSASPYDLGSELQLTATTGQHPGPGDKQITSGADFGILVRLA